MPNRRKFLKSVSAASLMPAAPAAFAATAKRDYFKELGVKPMINAAGTYTTFTASLMLPEVMEAINYASKTFVHLNELHDAVGKRIAELLHCEAAMVSSGAAGALVQGTAACITGTDVKKIRQLPDTTGMKNEVIFQKTHRYGYDHAIRNAGVKVIEIETAAELDRAVNERTAMMMFFNSADPKGQINAEEWVALGKKHNVPTFNDAAADSQPMENIFRYQKMGFDLVTFSGGKGIRGPQSAGLLLGRKDLIEAARLNGSPNSDSLGRGLKVNKEELLGMMVAVETFLKKDHRAEWAEWEKRCKIVADSVSPLKSVKTEVYLPEIANHVPHLRITWDQSAIKLSYADVQKRLRDGDPCIETVPGVGDGLGVGVWMLQPGEAQIVARRIREVLKAGA